MSDEPSSKRRKMAYKKQAWNQKPKFFLEPGIKGFLATCNFREKDCVRECYNLLNEYADQKPDEEKQNSQTAAIEKKESKNDLNDSGAISRCDDDDVEEEEDISSQLEKEIKTATQEQKTNRNRFQQVETKVPNCIFIKSSIDDPNELGIRIVRDIAETKKRKTRMLLRFMPVDAVCRANIENMKNTAGQLFDKVFLNTEPTTFSIIVNKRYNNDVDRMEIIHELADLITFKNSLHKVDLKNAKFSVVVEVVKGLCCISVLPDYIALKKYNVSELSHVKDDKDGAKIDAKKDTEVESTAKAGDADQSVAVDEKVAEVAANEEKDTAN